MEFNKLMEVRRSVRAYQPGKTIPEETLKELVKAAQMGPTWKNSQTGRYYVAASPEMVEQVRNECLPGFNQRSTAHASAYIITTFEMGIAGFTNGEADNELGDQWGPTTWGCATLT